MRDFTTDNKLNIVNYNDASATLLFEHIESYGNGLRFRVQEKDENGQWGGIGTDAEFTVYNTRPTRAQVIEQFSILFSEHFYD